MLLLGGLLITLAFQFPHSNFLIWALLLLVLLNWKMAISADHLLLMLLCLELISLTIFLFFLVFWGNNLSSLIALFIILTFAVSEASLGLSLLIQTTRISGTDLCSV